VSDLLVHHQYSKFTLVFSIVISFVFLLARVLLASSIQGIARAARGSFEFVSTTRSGIERLPKGNYRQTWRE
jgi:hypothetical protein